MYDQELIVFPNKERTNIGLLVCIFLIGIFAYDLYISSCLQTIFGYYITFFIQNILIFSILLFVTGFIYGIIQNKNSSPAVKLNKDGIWVKHFGFISWSEIDEFKEYIFPATPLIGIGIRVKDINQLSCHAPIIGKLGVFWSKIFGYPPIIITNIDHDNDQIIIFAQRFLNQKNHTE